MQTIALIVILLGMVNVIRMAAFLIGSDLYTIREHFDRKKIFRKRSTKALPRFSVVMPAHNESITILQGLDSVRRSKYPKKKMEVIVVDDGSTDDTLKILRAYKRKYRKMNLRIVTQNNAGKANALNNVLRNYVTGDLVMCLDADSSIDQFALREAARSFEDYRVVAMAANVRIKPTGTILNFTQRLEYLISYQIKRALTFYNIEYIIGGIGSVFRRNALKQVGYYDTNTITEDIDLTMKLIGLGNKEHRAIYNPRVIAHTEAVMDFKGLIRQRFRWKYGRTQTFFKHPGMFFNTDRKHSKLLTFLYLPYIVFSDLLYLTEPLLTAYLIGLCIYYQDMTTLIMAFAIMSSFIGFNILSEETLSWGKRLKLLPAAPAMYVLYHIINVVDYVALVKAFWQIRQIRASVQEGSEAICHWEHVERSGAKA